MTRGSRPWQRRRSLTTQPGRGKAPLPGLEPDVRLLVMAGVAYLEGSVSCYQRKKAMEQLVAKLPSVKEVVNRLRVVPGSLRSDRAIEEAVVAALQTELAPRLGSLSVRVSEGVVELRGTVPDMLSRIAAEAAAWSACGVQHVVNHVSVLEQKPLSSLGQSA